jgi:hypothetical protein
VPLESKTKTGSTDFAVIFVVINKIAIKIEWIIRLFLFEIMQVLLQNRAVLQKRGLFKQININPCFSLQTKYLVNIGYK